MRSLWRRLKNLWHLSGYATFDDGSWLTGKRLVKDLQIKEERKLATIIKEETDLFPNEGDIT